VDIYWYSRKDRLHCLRKFLPTQGTRDMMGWVCEKKREGERYLACGSLALIRVMPEWQDAKARYEKRTLWCESSTASSFVA
jgi:hypothetical protein